MRLGVRFLDNTIDVNRYALEEIADMNYKTRKIGLGVMGFADMLVKLGVPYDYGDGLDIGERVMSFIKSVADDTSRQLGEERGAYDAWTEESSAIKYRNACRLTVAPTGTISMIADCSSGIEPLFALAFEKRNILGGSARLKMVDKGFERVARSRGFGSDDLFDALAHGESLHDRNDVPDDVKSLFPVASGIEPLHHVLMQSVFQKSVDAGISKTINFPYSATVDDVEEAYMTAWAHRCKGITVYRSGSRQQEVLVAGTKDEPSPEPQFRPSHTLVDAASHLVRTENYLKPADRPVALKGRTVQVVTGRGRLYVTLNYRDNSRLFEVFIAHGKAGGNDAAMAEALSRLITMNLRCGVDPFEVSRTLRHITDKPVYSNGDQILSVPDAVAQVIDKFALMPLSEDMDETETRHASLWNGDASSRVELPSEESCPECYSPLEFAEGCKKCHGCGFSEC